MDEQACENQDHADVACVHIALHFLYSNRPHALQQAIAAPVTSAYFASFTAITSISTRKPGLASEATPTTERAGKLGWLKNCV